MSESKNFKEQIKKATKKVLEGSSLHAVPNIIQTESYFIKATWLIFLLISSSSCCWYLIKSIQNYFNYETVTNINIEQIDQLPFPIFSICKRTKLKEGFNKSVDLEKVITHCTFQKKKCDFKNDFEYYWDSYYQYCIRFNSGKYVNNRGNDFSLYFHLNSEHSYRTWITNETYDASEKEGFYIPSRLSWKNAFLISKITIIKQQKPYSDCLNGLDNIDSYNSEMYKRVFESSQQKYKYTDCCNLCKQKNFGEKCQMQVSWYGTKYFENMTELTWTLYLNNATGSECYESNINLSEDYLKQCDCPLECRTDLYIWDHSFGDITDFNVTNEVAFAVYYDEMKETMIAEGRKIEITDLVSSLGGILSLFTGFSFLSLVEIFEISIQITMILLERNSTPNRE